MVDVTGPQPILKGPGKLGEYTLLRRIGRGGMAEVYLAKKDNDLVDRNLVVKRMLPHLADDDRFVQMFLREARVAMQLSHPNVVQMLEVGVEGEEYFIAMEHLEGLSAYHLAKRVWAAQGSLPLELIAHTLCDAALGLEHAHTLRDLQGNNIGLVHRDISPDNIFVTKDGTSKILDFGIALGAFAGSLTRTGEIKGKVRYMSPEQMTKATGVDARADVFSLGATLYWLLTGRHAFDGDNDVVAMRSVLESEPPAPSSVNRSLPKELDHVVASMLRKDREGRVASAEDAYELLLPFSGGAAGRAKVTEFLRSALLLPPVKKRNEGEAETPLGVPAAVPWALFESTSVGASPVSPSGEMTFPSIAPGKRAPARAAEATVRVPVPMSSETPTDTPPEQGDEQGHAHDNEQGADAGAEPTSATPFSHIDGETLENALRPKAPVAVAPETTKRGGVVLIAAAGALGLVAAAIGFVLFRPGDTPAPVEVAQPAKPDERGDPVVDTAPVVVKDDVVAVAADTAVVVPADDDVVDRDAARVKRASKPTIKARAPGFVEWRTLNGALLGKGNDSLALPRDTKQIIAVDSKRKGKTRVDVDDEIDYAALPKGELSVIALPFADVYLGKEHLGRTPIKGTSLVAGAYEVKLVFENKTKLVKVSVDGGEKETVRVNMNAP